jgi:DNA-binding MarR family transcriptional regulator
MMQLIDGPVTADPAAAERLYRSLCRFRREMLREGLLGAIRSGEDLDLSLIQLGVLLLLDAEGERTIKAVAEELGRSLSATSRLLDQLVRRGLLTRREDPLDRRVKRVAISDAGRALLAKIERRRAAAQLAVMARLPAAAQADVLRAMELLGEAATGKGGEDGPAGDPRTGTGER